MTLPKLPRLPRRFTPPEQPEATPRFIALYRIGLPCFLREGHAQTHRPLISGNGRGLRGIKLYVVVIGIPRYTVFGL